MILRQRDGVESSGGSPSESSATASDAGVVSSSSSFGGAKDARTPDPNAER